MDELQLALHLARHAPDAFLARTLSRHVAVRTENFIAHARGLRKPLNQARFETRGFHKTKEVYADYFDEYFHLVRHRLGAHVQDFDFGKRIELWNDIEVVKIGFFVDGAKEIYEGLAPLKITGYVPFIEPADLTDAGLTKALQEFKGSAENRQWAEIGVDPLSMTRPNTATVLNMSPVHLRAGQLVLIRRWIKAQRDLVARLRGYEGMFRILKSRLITDVVSFFDGLVTRPVTAGAPQQMDGLNTLLVNSGQKPAAIDQFLGVYAVDPPLNAARELRDHFGAHLEIDDAVPLSALLSEIDSFDLESCLAFFDRLAQVFEKVCHEVLFLRMYVADGQRLYGVTPNATSVVSFDQRNPTPVTAAAPIPDYNNEQTYQDTLAMWLKGDEISRQDARQFFWQAFLYSEVVEQIAEVEDLGGGWRSNSHDLRKAHRFVIESLRTRASEDDFVKILELLLACSSGDPYMLAEILIRHSLTAPPQHDIPICYCLGELAGWPHKTVNAFLANRAATIQDWNAQFLAVLALFKIYVRSEGLARVNRKNPFRSYASDIAPLIAGMTEEKRLLCLIAFASQFCSPRNGSFAKVLSDEYSALQSEIEALCNGTSLHPICAPVDNLLHQLLLTHDYVGVCLLLADQLKAANLDSLADNLLTAACRGWVIAMPHSEARRNLAACFLRKQEFATALEIADRLATRNPDDVMLQLFVVQVLAGTPGAGAKAIQRIATIKADYKLTTAHQEMLAEIERYLVEPPRL
ncbi:MAG TPA: hypothetical protein VNE82_20260 [Candidatus Binataceae bacterium]|nr:hypothetical protein [Candidatus Binataceae bacterium]